MAKNDLLFLGGLAAIAYFLMQNNANANGGGGGGGGENPPLSPVTPYTPVITAEDRAAYPQVSPQTQAAIDAGSLNIFGMPQQTTPPGASSTKFMQQYSAAQAKAQAATGSPNIASPSNLLAETLPALYGINSVSGIIQAAAKSAAKKRTVTNITTNPDNTKNAIINGVQYKNQIQILR